MIHWAHASVLHGSSIGWLTKSQQIKHFSSSRMDGLFSADRAGTGQLGGYKDGGATSLIHAVSILGDVPSGLPAG